MRHLVFIACVGCGRIVDAAPDAAPIEDASVEAGASALVIACDRYFDAQYNRCGGPRLPSDENARVRARFEKACSNEVALPGSGVSIATLTECTNALEVSACELPYGPPPECDFRGGVAGGGACIDGVQCASGACVGQQLDTPDGPASPIECGTCAPLVGVGDVCASATVSAECDPKAICIADPSTADASPPTYRCTAVTRGDDGASCDGLASSCALGLYCAAQTWTCTPLEPNGAPCGDGKYIGGCVAPLACVGPAGSRACSSGSLGAMCASWLDCNAGLSCVPPSSGTCQPFTWGSAGQACDDSSTICLVGSCTFPGPRTCPVIVPDGQPCTAADECDTFSDCVDAVASADAGFVHTGTCVLHDSLVCP